MKKTLPTIVATLVIIAYLSNNSFAQGIAKSERTSIHTNEMLATERNTTTTANTALSAKFADMFPNAENAVWSTDAKGSVVSFTNEGRTIRAGFNNKGRVNYTVTSCTKEHLTNALQLFITKNYAGYELFNAIEINAFGESTQQIVLQNTNSFVTLKSTSDGIEEIRKTSKQ